MLPLYPPYAIADLAHEHLEGRLPDGRPRRRDPDGSFAESMALQPNPVFMGLRKLVTGGPIGGVAHWIDQRIEAREDRIHHPRIEGAVSTIAFTERARLSEAVDDDRPERKTAA
jgi:hypothetical protein